MSPEGLFILCLELAGLSKMGKLVLDGIESNYGKDARRIINND
jgi:hypothetical protein